MNITDGQGFVHALPVVLYVEDHAVNLLLMRALFERKPDVELICATSGHHARAIAPKLSPSLLLLDLRLPDCHGSDLLRQLRELPSCRTVPAVAVTADSDFDISGTGFVELWSKPLDLHVVLNRLEALMQADSPHGVASPLPERLATGQLSPSCSQLLA